MADIRELIILNPGVIDPKPETRLTAFLLDTKMSLRRIIVRSSGSATMQRLYRAIYTAHLRFAALLGRRFAGTDAVYLTSGMATGEVNLGISDIDLAFYGSWPEQRQFTLMKLFGACAILSPLFDKRSLASIGTIADLQVLCATDMFNALTHAKGRLQWKLLYGEDVLQQLPPIAADRFAGCVYMDLRRWWSTLTIISFGNDVTTRDPIFQNSICYKAVAEMLRSERMLAASVPDITPRAKLVEQQARTGDPTAQLLHESAGSRFLTIAHDPRPATLTWFLQHAELFHGAFRELPGCAALVPVRFDPGLHLPLAQRGLTAATLSHAEHLVARALRSWPSLRAAFLVPAAVMFSPDSFALVLEADPAHLPSAEVLRAFRAAHRDAVPLPQRLAVYLLLDQAAYQLDAGGTLEFFQYTLTPYTSPDVFAAMRFPAAVLHGVPSGRTDDLCWSPVAQELMLEELNARRGAHRRFGVQARPSALENLRNLLRLLQLVVMERTAAAGEIFIPSTVAAICRAAMAHIAVSASDLESLQQMHQRACDGDAVSADVAALLQRVYTSLTAAGCA